MTPLFQPPDKVPQELVYFIVDHEDQDHSWVKIGKSAKKETEVRGHENQHAVAKRFSACQTYNPRPLLLLGYLQGFERYWHNVFHEHAVAGEWFNYQPIKHVILNLRLSACYDVLRSYKDSCKAEVWNTFYKENSHLDLAEKEEKYADRERKCNQIDRMTYEEYKFSRDIEDHMIVRNAWRTGRGYLDNNERLNAFLGFADRVQSLLAIIYGHEPCYTEKRRNSIVDSLRDVIHEKEPYYQFRGIPTQLSWRSALHLFESVNTNLIELADKRLEKQDEAMRDALDKIDEVGKYAHH